MTITTRFSIIKKDLLKAKDFEKNKKGYMFVKKIKEHITL
jgi:hypothetical protein